MTVLKFGWVENLVCTFSFSFSYSLECGQQRRYKLFWQTISVNTTASWQTVTGNTTAFWQTITGNTTAIQYCHFLYFLWKTLGQAYGNHTECTVLIRDTTSELNFPSITWYRLQYRSLYVCYVETPRCRPQRKDMTTSIWINPDGKSKSSVHHDKQWTRA
jgi:hypothetical protein